MLLHRLAVCKQLFALRLWKHDQHAVPDVGWRKEIAHRQLAKLRHFPGQPSDYVGPGEYMHLIFLGSFVVAHSQA